MILRVATYIGVAGITLVFMAWLFYVTLGKVLASILSTFVAAVVANLVVLRSTEHRSLLDIGLRWSGRNLLLGLAGGIGAATLVLAPPLLLRVASLQKAAEPISAATALFTLLSLMIGAASEEMLFRGYAFQLLVNRLGTWLPIIAISVLFGWGHTANPHATVLGTVNTALWGMLLGFAIVRSRDLWFAIGLHFGWNLTLPLFGAPLSGLTIKLTNYTLQWSVPEYWSGGEYGPEAGLLTLFVLLPLAWFLYKAPVDVKPNPVLQASGEE